MHALQDPPFVEPQHLVIAELPDCRVRSFRRSDIPAVQRELCDPEVWRSYLPEDGSPDIKPSYIENYLRWLHESDVVSFAACDPRTDDVIGCIHGRRGPGAMSRTVELSGWLARRHWRSSIARRVNQVFVEWLFEDQGVMRVSSHTYHPNRAAIGALRAAGFTLEARLRNAGVKDGFLMDRLVFVRLNPVIASMPRAPDRQSDWLQHPAAPAQVPSASNDGGAGATPLRRPQARARPSVASP
jgi:RimJ/RimL family protein N-acetyltransferase